MQKDFGDREIDGVIDELQKSQQGPDLTFQVPLKIPPKHGAFLFWPGNADDWVHPEDIETAYQLIPSNRIFRREDIGDGYYRLTYGRHQLRVRSAIWVEVVDEGYEVGDQVEVKSRLGRGRPFIARIEEIRWEKENRRIRYWLSQSGQTLKTPFTSDLFQLAESIGSHVTERKLKLLARARFR